MEIHQITILNFGFFIKYIDTRMHIIGKTADVWISNDISIKIKAPINFRSFPMINDNANNIRDSAIPLRIPLTAPP